MNLTEKLHFLMKKKGIKNISQLSKETAIPYTTLKSIFDEDVFDIRLSTSQKLCSYFNITFDELLSDNTNLTNSILNELKSEIEKLNTSDRKVILNYTIEALHNKLFKSGINHYEDLFFKILIKLNTLSDNELEQINDYVDYIKHKK